MLGKLFGIKTVASVRDRFTREFREILKAQTARVKKATIAIQAKERQRLAAQMEADAASTAIDNINKLFGGTTNGNAKQDVE
jgi:hypothetical protein